jgi:hypothetical protein
VSYRRYTASLLAGFAFTTPTLLITLLPDPIQTLAQVILFCLAVLFDLYLFLVGWNSFTLVYLCKKVPPSTRQFRIFNYLSLFAYCAFGAMAVLIFLVSKLIYLTLASGVAWIIFIIATYLMLWRPFRRFPETRARIRARTREKEKAHQH